jgi:hypothetical protein
LRFIISHRDRKTTLARQILSKTNIPSHYPSADEPVLRDREWIEQQWELARLRLKSDDECEKGILVLDEIQKVTGWSETVKRLWDEDTGKALPLHVVILGSSQLFMQQGLTESLAGRFEIIPIRHWSFTEMRDAFGWDVDRYLYFGGYPGAVALIQDQERWRRYIIDSLIETTVSRDVLLMRRVDFYKIWFFNGTFYLIGHCHVRDEVRIFALDLIKMLHPAFLSLVRLPGRQRIHLRLRKTSALMSSSGRASGSSRMSPFI